MDRFLHLLAVGLADFSDSYKKRIDFSKYKKKAAVLVPIVFYNNRYCLLFTRRTEHLKNHSGEISFPGGGYDDTDGDLKKTVLREVKEEVGIDEKDISLLGNLPQEFSVTYFSVTPFVGFIEKFDISKLVIDKREVNNLLIVPLNFFLNRKNRWSEVWLRNEERHVNYFYNYNGNIIWGLTGRITYIFSKIVKRCFLYKSYG